MDPSAGPIGRYFDGEATSEVGLRSEGGEDLWTAFQPDLTSIQDDIARGNRQLADVGLDAQGLAIIALAESYAANPPPATFRVIVNPLVVWVWVGGLIALGGALFAVWPTAESRRRAEAAYAARLRRQRADGALVRLVSGVYGGEMEAAVDARLQHMAGLVTPLLDRYVPD